AEELEDRLAEFDAIADALAQPVLRWYTLFQRSWAELLVGRIAESERLALEALQLGNDTGQPDAIAIFVAQLAMIRRDQGRLDELVDAVARQVTDNPGIPGFGILLALCHCELDRYLGMLATTLGRYFEADAHFAAAAAIHTRIGAPAWLARTQVDWGRMLLRRDGKGDAEQAGELLASALRTARRIGLPTVERRSAALLHRAL